MLTRPAILCATFLLTAAATVAMSTSCAQPVINCTSAHGQFAAELAAAIYIQWRDRIAFDIRGGLAAIEDVVRRDVHQRDIEGRGGAGNLGRRFGIDAPGEFGLGPVDAARWTPTPRSL